MNKADTIRALLEATFTPSLLNITDNSSMHAGHAGVRPGGETHFRVEITSEKFTGLSRIARHRLINDSLKELFQQGLHALEIHTRSPE